MLHISIYLIEVKMHKLCSQYVFGTRKIQKQNSELVQLNTASLISILPVCPVSVYSRAEIHLCKSQVFENWMMWNSGCTRANHKSHPSACQWFQWGQDLCLPSFLAAWGEWVIHTGSAAPCWGLGTVAFSPENRPLLPSGRVCSSSLLLRRKTTSGATAKTDIQYLIVHTHLDIYPYTRLWVLAPRRCFSRHISNLCLIHGAVLS